MTTVSVGTHTHSITYVATSLLRSLKWLIRGAGLDPSKFAADWATWEEGIAHWLGQRALVELVLEIYDPTDRNDDRRGRVDFTLEYSYSGDGDFWIDPDIVNFTVRKNGSVPSLCEYRLVATVRPGATDPPGSSWATTALRSTDGFQRHSVGTALAASSTSANLSYYRRSN